MTLLYNANLIKLKNNNVAKRNKMAESVGKDKLYQTQPQTMLHSRFQSIDSRINFDNKRETIRNFYNQEQERQSESKANGFLNLNTIKSSKMLLEHKKQLSGVSLKLVDNKENRLPREFSQSIAIPSKNSCENIGLQAKTLNPRKVKLNFTSNPIYAKFKKMHSPDKGNLDHLKSSMVQVIKKIDGFEREQKEYTLKVLPSLNRINKIQASSLLVLNKKLKNKEPELLR